MSKRKHVSEETQVTKEPEHVSEETQVRVPVQKIETEEQAIELVLLSYKVPDTTKTVWVSEDKQVFFKAGPASLHQRERNVKIFAIKWD